MSGYFVSQLLGYVVLALFFIFLLRRTRARLGLRPNLFKP
jgi:hypothetical protein